MLQIVLLGVAGYLLFLGREGCGPEGFPLRAGTPLTGRGGIIAGTVGILVGFLITVALSQKLGTSLGVGDAGGLFK